MQVLSDSVMSDGSFSLPKIKEDVLIWLILAFFILWQKTSLSRSCCELTLVLQDDLGRKLPFHHLPYFLPSFCFLVLVAKGDRTFFSFCLELSRFLCQSTILMSACFRTTQLVTEQLESRTNAPRSAGFPVDGSTSSLLHSLTKRVLTLPSNIRSSS